MKPTDPRVDWDAIERDVLAIISAKFQTQTYITLKDLTYAALNYPELCYYLTEQGYTTPKCCRARITMLANKRNWQWFSNTTIRNPVTP